MRNGHSARRARESSDGIRTLTLTAITRRSFVDAHTKMTTADPDRVRDLWLEPNDILVQRANTPELVGSSAMFDGPAGWAIFPDLLIRLRPDETHVLPAYLALALQAERTHRALRSKAKGLAGSMPKIDQTAIGSTVIPLRPLEEQRRTVVQAKEAEGAATRLANEIARCQSRSVALRRSLLQAAFSARLTGHSSDVERAEEVAR